MLKKPRKAFLTLCVFFTLVLSACDSENSDTTTVISTPDTTFSSLQATLPEMSISVSENETTDVTASLNDIQNIIDEAELQQIVITENSSPEEIMQGGKVAAKFYAESTEKYFGYGVERLWKLSYEDNDILDSIEMKPYQTASIYRKSLGLYTDTKDAYVLMNGEESKQFLIDHLGLTENGYEELCENSPSTYVIKDGDFYVSSGDGGQAGWDSSDIVSYEMQDNTVTYTCEIVGKAENWGYDEDKVWNFTFRLADEDGIWKLDGVSCAENFFLLQWLNMD